MLLLFQKAVFCEGTFVISSVYVVNYLLQQPGISRQFDSLFEQTIDNNCCYCKLFSLSHLVCDVVCDHSPRTSSFHCVTNLYSFESQIGSANRILFCALLIPSSEPFKNSLVFVRLARKLLPSTSFMKKYLHCSFTTFHFRIFSNRTSSRIFAYSDDKPKEIVEETSESKIN